MLPDGITIHLITQELQPLINGRVERVYQPEQQEILLIIRSSGRNHRLLLASQADCARIHVTTRDKVNPPAPPPFCLLLRKYLEGSRLLRIEQVGLDRVVHLIFSRLDESGEFKEITLVVEIMGKHSNLILMDPQSGTIIDGIRRYSHALSRYREVLPGRPYIPPPGQQKTHPAELDMEDFLEFICKETLDKTLEEAVFQKVAGLGPELVREILHRANLEPHLRLEYCGEYELRSLWDILRQAVIPLLEGRAAPTIVYEGKRPLCYAPVPLTRYTGMNQVKCDTVNQMLDEFYAARSAVIRFQQLQGHLLAILKREMGRCAKKMALQQEAEAEAGEADAYRIRGEMLLAHLHLVRPGDREVSVSNLYEPEAPLLRIELDPSLSPAQNAQRLFKKYEKARDSLKVIRKQVELTAREIDYLASVKTALDQAETMDELNEIKSELEETGYLKPKNNGKAKPPGRSNPPRVLRLLSRDGWEIMIGKNNRQNDYLTMRLAKDDDLWLHVKEAAGAHVIVKAKSGVDIPPTTLEEAAGLAAYFSEARHSSKVPVDYTRRKNVTKPPKARPGFVIYRNHQTLLAIPTAPAAPVDTG